MEIVSYSGKYFEPLVAFLRKNWAPNHSIYDKCLFDWQYGGCAGDLSASVLLLDDNGKIQGFLGAIQYPFLFYDETKTAAGLAIWVVDKDIKNSGAGLYLRKTVEDNFDIVYTIGLNPATIRYYQKRNYNYYDSLNRYVIPLDANKYQSFLLNLCENEEIKDWLNTVRFTEPAAPSVDFNANTLAEIYQNSVAPHFTLRPQKDATFWEWRYLNSKGFSYLFYQASGGVVVFRVDNTHSPDDPLRHGVKCLRIIEILPDNGKVWDGDVDEDLIDTVLSVLTWAKEQGCVLADFQISNSRLSHILEEIGFRLQLNEGKTNISRLFSPYRANASPLNFVYRTLSNSGKFISINREDTYLLKSETDMDRPNFLQ